MGTRFDGDLYDYIYKHTRNKLVFDVGANIGVITKFFLDSKAHVVAIEPQGELTNNKNFNGALVRNVCVSDKVGEVVFYANKSHSTLSSCFSGWKSIHPADRWVEIQIKSTTLDTLIEEFGKPVFIKIDVEGYEHEVLAGLSYKIDLIGLEFTGGFIDTFLGCVEHIERLGYEELITFKVHKIKKNSKLVERYSIVDVHEDTNALIDYFMELPKKQQGDLLVKL